MKYTTLFPSQFSLGALATALPILVDPKVGIVHHVEEVPTEPGSPNFFHYSAQACNTSAFCSQANFANTGGASSHRPIAIAKAVGEAIERYCAAIYDHGQLPLSSYRDAPFACARPSDFALHTTKQYQEAGFPWVPFENTTPIKWTPARRLIDGTAMYVPAAFVWIPYLYYQGSGDTPIGQPISTGLACHGSYARAALSGLCEVIERDAFMIFWLAKLSCPHLRVETLSDANYDLVKRFESTGDRVVLLNITTDNSIPTILAILCSEASERPAFVFAAATEPDPEQAVRKALEELAHTRRYSQQIKRRLPPIMADNDYEQVLNQIDHLNFAGDHASKELFDFAFASTKRQDFDDLISLTTGNAENDLETVVQRVHATGHEVLIADLSSADVLDLGLHVVRCVVPGYQPLFMGHRIRALGGIRLRTVPERLGYSQKACEASINTAPHPYP